MGKYKIYHISGVKIGVSVKPKARVESQGYVDYEILEQHDCIYKVSDREIELQKEYGYVVDKTPYYKFMQNRNTKGSLGRVNSKEVRKRMSDAAKRRKKQGAAKLTPEKVIYIRSQYATGKYSQTRLGNVFGLTQTGISRIIKKQSWSKL
jgi:hypothetical protein